MVRRRLVVILGIGAAAIALAQSVGPGSPGGGGGTGLPSNVLTGHVASGSLDFEEVSPSGYSAPLTMAVTGAETGDAVRCNATVSISPLLVTQWVSGADEVSIVLTNTDTFSSVNPPSIVFACVVTE